MTRDDINYWLSPKFDHVPPTDEELDYGRPISKSQLARSIGLEIKQILIREGSIPAAAEMRINQLARMVKDEEPEADDEEADAALNDAYAEGRKDEREELLAGRVVERTTGDRFENAVREFGVVNACEWFGHRADSEFTKESIRILAERAKATGEAQ